MTGGGYDFTHLRFVRVAREEDEGDERTGPWRPAADAFPDWPGEAAALRVLDPCCGSGHFLVETFELLVRLRMAEERVSVEEAIRLVLRDNLFGLEIDPRCTQIAAFNLALAAWRLVGEPIDLPPLNIACTGLAPNATEAEWRELAEAAEGSTGLAEDRDLFGGEASLARGPLQEGMAALHRLFRRAPELGSLLDPGSLGSDLFRADFKSLAKLLDLAIRRERGSVGRDERAVAAAGMARAAEILQGRYTLVVTNVPFLARGKQGRGLRSFAETHHGDAKGDIATVFVSRIFGWLGEGGTQAVVTPQNWLFLKTYRKLRERLLKERTWNLVARLGPGAFETITGHVVNVALNIISEGRARILAGRWRGWTCRLHGGSVRSRQPRRAELLRGGAGVVMSRQGEQLKNPDSRILLEPFGSPLTTVHESRVLRERHTTGDRPRYLLCAFWELPPNTTLRTEVARLAKQRGSTFRPGAHCCKVPVGDTEELRARLLVATDGTWIRVAGRGVAVRKIGDLTEFLYDGEVFDDNVGYSRPHVRRDPFRDPMGFCAPDYHIARLRRIDRSSTSRQTHSSKSPSTSITGRRSPPTNTPTASPNPIPTTRPNGSSTAIRAAAWSGTTRPNAPTTARRALTQPSSRWPLPASSAIAGQRSWITDYAPCPRAAGRSRPIAAHSMSLRTPTVLCASPPRAANRKLPTVSAALLAAAYGDQWSAETERALLAATSPKPPKSLEDWLRDRFFHEHCQALPQPALHLAHLGRPQGRLPRARQLPPVGRPGW